MLRSDVFPELINHRLVKPVFAAVVLLLFLGPQVRCDVVQMHLLAGQRVRLLFVCS